MKVKITAWLKPGAFVNLISLLSDSYFSLLVRFSRGLPLSSLPLLRSSPLKQVHPESICLGYKRMQEVAAS